MIENLINIFRALHQKHNLSRFLVSGKASTIDNIQGEHIAFTGKYEDVNKDMPVNQGVWRN